jgi:hypothetical protein
VPKLIITSPLQTYTWLKLKTYANYCNEACGVIHVLYLKVLKEVQRLPMCSHYHHHLESCGTPARLQISWALGATGRVQVQGAVEPHLPALPEIGSHAYFADENTSSNDNKPYHTYDSRPLPETVP